MFQFTKIATPNANIFRLQESCSQHKLDKSVRYLKADDNLNEAQDIHIIKGIYVFKKEPTVAKLEIEIQGSLFNPFL